MSPSVCVRVLSSVILCVCVCACVSVRVQPNVDVPHSSPAVLLLLSLSVLSPSSVFHLSLHFLFATSFLCLFSLSSPCIYFLPHPLPLPHLTTCFIYPIYHLFSLSFLHLFLCRHPWTFIVKKGEASSVVEDHAVYQGRKQFTNDILMEHDQSGPLLWFHLTWLIVFKQCAGVCV